MIPKVELRPLRKNAKNASYRVLEVNLDGVVKKETTYETIREAVYHTIIRKAGDIVTVANRPKLVAFWSDWDKNMRFGHDAKECEKTVWASDLHWANF